MYRERFSELFNYAVAPLYWDTLEPEEGKPRFDEKTSPNIDRRPPLDNIRLCKDNTGYDNRLCDFRGTDIII
jgi:hypothetical protein